MIDSLGDEEASDRGLLQGVRVCMSGDGRGACARAIMALLAKTGAQFVEDAADLEATRFDGVADICVCTLGTMLIRSAGDVTPAELDRLHRGNYLLPRAFTERHIASMKRDGVHGLIIHLGSNASFYGNPHADDYGAYKSALRKYLELRARIVRDDGIRISHLAFGGIASAFWDKATAGAPPELAKSIVPGTRHPLTVDEVAAVVVSTLFLPPNVVIRDALIVARDYQ